MSQEPETWVLIKDSISKHTMYQISSMGRIRSVFQYKTGILKFKILSPYLNNGRTPVIKIPKGGKVVKRRVSSLFYSAFPKEHGHTFQKSLALHKEAA